MSGNDRIVAHLDILGMSTLVEKNFLEAWGMLSDLVSVRDNAQIQEYEFVETKERLRVFERTHIITFSDTLFLFTAGATSLELKSMIILVSEIFHKALFKCVPIRAGIAVGKFWFNPDKSMYAGPALIEACRTGESAQWIGITLSESVSKMAIAQDMKSGCRDVIVNWPIPLKNGERNGYVINWPAIFAHTIKKKPPISVEDFYKPFERTFGDFNSLDQDDQNKYKNTVCFMNCQLE